MSQAPSIPRRIIDVAESFTLGSGADFADLNALSAYLDLYRIVPGGSVQAAPNAVLSIGEDTAFHHPDGDKVTFAGDTTATSKTITGYVSTVSQAAYNHQIKLSVTEAVDDVEVGDIAIVSYDTDNYYYRGSAEVLAVDTVGKYLTLKFTHYQASIPTKTVSSGTITIRKTGFDVQNGYDFDVSAGNWNDLILKASGDNPAMRLFDGPALHPRISDCAFAGPGDWTTYPNGSGLFFADDQSLPGAYLDQCGFAGFAFAARAQNRFSLAVNKSGIAGCANGWMDATAGGPGSARFWNTSIAGMEGSALKLYNPNEFLFGYGALVDCGVYGIYCQAARIFVYQAMVGGSGTYDFSPDYGGAIIEKQIQNDAAFGAHTRSVALNAWGATVNGGTCRGA